MKKLLFLFSTLFCVVNTGFAQELITDEGVRLKPGIYRSFKEFVTNSPSLYPEVANQFSKNGGSSFNPKSSGYRLNLPGDLLTEEDIIWGFCTGRAVYINSRTDKLYRKKTDYEKLLSIGRYCYFESKYNVVRKELAPSNNEAILRWALDINTGIIYALDDEWLSNLLEKDKAMQNEYQNSAGKKYMTRHYLQEYSKTYKDEINLWEYLK